MSSNLPPVTWLRAFDAAARHLSFTLAGQELGLTQSAVSQHVRNLEGFLGQELFLRKTRALALTEGGASYLPVVREAFEVLARGTEAFIGGDRGRSLILQCNMAFSIFWLAPRLPDLYARHPWLVLNVITPIWDPERNARTAAAEIRFGRASELSPAAERLTHDRYFPVCRPDYPVDLRAARLFDCTGTTGTWSTWHASQDLPFDRAGEVNLGSTYVISVNAALAGAGMAIGQSCLVEGLLAKGDLIAPFDHAPSLADGYFLMPPAAHSDTPASRAFVDWLGEALVQSSTDFGK